MKKLTFFRVARVRFGDTAQAAMAGLGSIDPIYRVNMAGLVPARSLQVSGQVPG